MNEIIRDDVVPFSEATVGEETYTYRPDPSGEYGWLTDPEWWGDLDDPETVTRQRWRLVSEDTVVFHPLTELCPRCHGEGQERYPVGSGYADHDCTLCGGSGGHPLAGQMEVLS